MALLQGNDGLNLIVKKHDFNQETNTIKVSLLNNKEMIEVPMDKIKPLSSLSNYTESNIISNVYNELKNEIMQQSQDDIMIPNDKESDLMHKLGIDDDNYGDKIMPVSITNKIKRKFVQFCLYNEYVQKTTTNAIEPIETTKTNPKDAIYEAIEEIPQLKKFQSKSPKNKCLMDLMGCEAIIDVYLHEAELCNNNLYFEQSQFHTKNVFIKPKMLGILDSVNFINNCDQRCPVYSDSDVLTSIGWSKKFNDPGVSDINIHPSLIRRKLSPDNKESMKLDILQPKLNFHRSVAPFVILTEPGFNTDLVVDKIIRYFSENYGPFVYHWVKQYLIDVKLIYSFNLCDTNFARIIDDLRKWASEYDRLAVVVPSILFKNNKTNFIQYLFLNMENYHIIHDQIPQFKWNIPNNNNEQYNKVQQKILNNTHNNIGNQRQYFNNNGICSKFIQFNTVIQLSLSNFTKLWRKDILFYARILL